MIISRRTHIGSGIGRALSLVLGLAVLVLLTGSIASAHASEVGSRLGSGGQLHAGDVMRSPNRQFWLVMQSDGNLVEYTQHDRWVWHTATGGHPGSTAVMQPDGNLVVYDAAGHYTWATMKFSRGSYLELQDDGNLVNWSTTRQPVWATYRFNNYLMPGQRLTPNESLSSPNHRNTLWMQTNGNLVEYNSQSQAIWNSGTDGHPNAYLVMGYDGNLVLFSASGTVLWDSRTAGHDGGFLQLQDDTNSVLRSSSGQPLFWFPLGANCTDARKVVDESTPGLSLTLYGSVCTNGWTAWGNWVNSYDDRKPWCLCSVELQGRGFFWDRNAGALTEWANYNKHFVGPHFESDVPEKLRIWVKPDGTGREATYAG